MYILLICIDSQVTRKGNSVKQKKETEAMKKCKGKTSVRLQNAPDGIRMVGLSLHSHDLFSWSIFHRFMKSSLIITWYLPTLVFCLLLVTWQYQAQHFVRDLFTSLIISVFCILQMRTTTPHHHPSIRKMTICSGI